MSAVLFARGVAITAFPFTLINRGTGEAIDSGTVTVYITKDGTQSPATNTPTYNGNGEWLLDITADERDAKITSLTISHDSAVTQHINIVSDAQLGPGSKEVNLDFGSVASGADFWVTSQVNDTVIASGLLDGDGQATLYLDVGDYYVFAQKTGINFNNPNAISVT